MPVNALPEDSRLRLTYKIGEEMDGTPILRTRTYNRLKPEASDSIVYQFAIIIADLQKFSLYGVSRVNEVKLEEV
ncbi:MAG: DUF1659 domain-containing protein [Clostridia bacterium]|nr:DUF1659 domain-containing protein [Clostridia bacterium]